MRIKILIICIIGIISCKRNSEIKWSFEPTDLNVIRSFKYDYVDVALTNDTSNKFKSIYERPSIREKFDSLYPICIGCERKIGDVQVSSILRYDSLSKVKVILYEDSGYEDMAAGYWVSISHDNGKSWNKFYTGLVANHFFYFKPNSRSPLFRTDSLIQVEAALVRQISPYLLPGGAANFELVQDNLILTLNLCKIAKDSDNDGLTDIVENKFMTNPYDADTDKDGVPDGNDKNPRFKSNNCKKIVLYEYLLEHPKTDVLLDFNKVDFHNRYHPSGDNGIYMLITDDSDIQQISPADNTYIILRTSEVAEYMKHVTVTLVRLSLSSLEKKYFFGFNKYKVSIEGNFWKDTYTVKKTSKGWILKMAGGYII